MAQQMITLEEAAAKLGISPEEMKKRLKTDPDFKRLSQIRDGTNVRFKLAAIEELARQLGMASEQDLPLAPAEPEPPGSDDFKVPTLDDRKKPKGDDLPLEFDSSADDVFSLADEPKPPPPKSSGKLNPGKPAKPPAKGMSDSSTGSTDSDVKLEADKPRKAPSDQAGVPTEEISLDFSGPGSAVIKGGSSAKLSAPRASPSSGKLSASNAGNKSTADSSEFELSLDADSDDFEMQLNPEAADEVDLGAMPDEKGPGASSSRAGKSGINLRDPADSGIPLDKGKGSDEGSTADDAEPDFELSLDSSSVASSTRLGAPKSGKLVLDAGPDADSDSEFELTLEDTGGSSLEQAALGSVEADEAADKGDIFETDFEIPPMEESGSDAVPVDADTDLEQSDFISDDVVIEEEPSESEVVLLGDEDEEAPAAGKSSAKLKGPKSKKRKKGGEEDDEAVEVTDEDEDSAAGALKGAKGKRRGAEDEDEDEEAAPAGAMVERPTKPWGVVPVLLLAPTAFVLLIGALMAFESLNTMWSYQQPRKPTAPLVRGIADTFGMDIHEQ